MPRPGHTPAPIHSSAPTALPAWPPEGSCQFTAAFFQSGNGSRLSAVWWRYDGSYAHRNWYWPTGNLTGALLDEIGATCEVRLVEMLLAAEGEQLCLPD